MHVPALATRSNASPCKWSIGSTCTSRGTNLSNAGCVIKCCTTAKTCRFEKDNCDYEDPDLFAQKWRRTAHPRVNAASGDRITAIVPSADIRLVVRIEKLEKAAAALRPGFGESFVYSIVYENQTSDFKTYGAIAAGQTGLVWL